MQPVPYLFFKGNCRAAVTRYAEIFGVTPEIMDFSSMPKEARDEMPGTPDDAVMHASLKIGDGWIYASDESDQNAQPMAGCNVNLSFKTEAETVRVFEALAKGGEVRMPLMPLFFAPLFGALTDEFGIRWMIMADEPEGALT